MNGAVAKRGEITAFNGSQGTIKPDKGVMCYFEKAALRYECAKVGDKVKFIPVFEENKW